MILQYLKTIEESYKCGLAATIVMLIIAFLLLCNREAGKQGLEKDRAHAIQFTWLLVAVVAFVTAYVFSEDIYGWMPMTKSELLILSGILILTSQMVAYGIISNPLLRAEGREQRK